MKLIKITNWLLILLAITLVFALPLKAQVNIGSQKTPEAFSILELTTSMKEGGLRLPQLTTQQREDLNLDKLTDPGEIAAAKGLVIFNISTRCLEFWGGIGKGWISLCSGSSSCTPIIGVSISPTSGNVIVTNTVQLTAGIMPTKASDVSYTWEYWNGMEWKILATTTVPTYSAEILFIGDNRFRVNASNGCSSITSGEAVITGIYVVPPPDGGSASRITWDAAANGGAGGYAITYDPRDAGLYFKFGSVVGVFSDHHQNRNLTENGISDDPFDSGDVAWTPTGATYNHWLDLPYVSSPMTVDATYHAANVKNGRGDPCRLIGLNLNKIANTPAGLLTQADIDNGEWRMPTHAENMAFYGYSSDQNSGVWWWVRNEPGNISFGVPGGEFPAKGLGGKSQFLPAAGNRYHEDGKSYMQLLESRYWTSEFQGIAGRCIVFTSTHLNIANYFDPLNGMNVRCMHY